MFRRQLAFAFVLLLLAAVSGAIPAPAQTSLPPGDDAAVARVVSGDTIEVAIQDIGFTIAYLGIDAPDKGECYAAQALAANAKLVKGNVLRVEREISDFDPAGRRGTGARRIRRCQRGDAGQPIPRSAGGGGEGGTRGSARVVGRMPGASGASSSADIHTGASGAEWRRWRPAGGVLQDLHDREVVRGFVHFAAVYVPQGARLRV